MKPVRSTLLILLVFSILFPDDLKSQDLDFNKKFNLGFKILNGRKKVDIPFESHNNLVVVPVVLNGKLPLRFILDTGVRTAILTNRLFSDVLNLSYSMKKTIYGAGGEKLIDAFVANNVSIELPGIRGEGHALFVLEEDLLQLRNYLGAEVHGILGYELFSRFIVEIHYDRGFIRIRDPESFKPKRKYQRIPMQVEDTKPYVSAYISIKSDQTIPVKLMIDTGASHAIMLMNDSHQDIYIPEKNIESNLGRGLSGEIIGKIARINSFKLGEYTFNKPIVAYPYPETYPDSLNRSLRNGTIGGGITSRFDIIFNFYGEELYIKKNSDFKRPFYYNLTGLVIRAKGKELDIFEIAEVRENSAGKEAGLKEGDIITEINGNSTEDLKLDNILGYFNKKANKKVVLEVNRDGKLIRTSFRLEDII